MNQLMSLESIRRKSFISRTQTTKRQIYTLSLFAIILTLSSVIEAAVYDGTVGSEQKISDTAGGFGGVLADSDLFGFAVASIGDLDGDGVADLAVGAPVDDEAAKLQRS